MPNRREFLSAAAAYAAIGSSVARGAQPYRMGVGTASYMQRAYADRQNRNETPFSETLKFLDHCHNLGAAGIQAGLSSIEGGYPGKVRSQAAKYGMYVEVTARLPKDDSDLPLFQKTVRAAANAGATVIRSVNLLGRRYESFRTAEEWERFRQQSWKSLAHAEPILRKRKIKLALENHKDWRIEDMLDMLKRISSEYIGVTLDTGNNVSLMEDPLEVARALAPYANSVHLKDMGVEPYEDGFMLSEVPFGEGFLDLKGIVDVIRAAKPSVNFTLEMITRDPLKIPYFTDQYWVALKDLPGHDLARMIDTVRKHSSAKLPRVEHLSWEERFRIEEENNRKCLEYGGTHLGL